MNKLSLFFFLIFSCSLFGQDYLEHELKDIVVSAQRTPVEFSNLTRNVKIITAKEISAAPVNDIQDILQYFTGVDLKQRGVDGVQADLSIRGGSYEQTLILIDGIKVSDPQTGHHNLNLPVSFDNIQRIEILKGQGSRVHGPNAFSGVVNFITKKGSSRELDLSIQGGENGYYNTSANVSYPLGMWNNRISVSKKASDGYIKNTEFENTNFSLNSSINFKKAIINLFAGYNDKEFGANKFYSTAFPNQWEHTTTKFVNLSGNFNLGGVSLVSKAYWRNNEDDYILDNARPDWYRNLHETDVYGMELQTSFEWEYGKTAFGGEFIKDEIESTNLGNHDREKKGLFLEHQYNATEKWIITGGAFLYDYAQIGWKLWPGFETAYKLTKQSRLFFSIGKSFRIPTYTELFYSSPTNAGNADLESEETLNYEVGYNYQGTGFNASASVFRKEGTNIIDWAKEAGSTMWEAMNIAEINTNGFEFSFDMDPQFFIKNSPVYNLGLSYTFLNADKELGNLESRYLLDHLKHQVILKMSHYLFFDIRQNWIFRYEDRENFEDSFVTDLQLNRQIENFNVFVKVTNLFNDEYKDITGLSLPGRWIRAGIKFNLSN